ncbi:MAG: sigma-70 family RNA polymerase sigma factor [Terracidiphilus sp.]|jgi:RNA polymerase sigma-70 factor (ECF subfamily)
MDGSRTSVNDLAKACAHSADAAEWEEFLRRCTPLASLVAMRISRSWVSVSSPATVSDIVQEIFLKLCEQERRILREFEPRCEDSFLGLLRMVSASVANDYFRRIYSAKRGGKVVTMPLAEDGAPGTATSSHTTAELERSVLLAQLDQKMRSAPDVIGERDRALFWLYYRQGLTAEEIAAITGAGLTAKGVESALRRVAKWLRGEVEKQNSGGQPETG